MRLNQSTHCVDSVGKSGNADVAAAVPVKWNRTRKLFFVTGYLRRHTSFALNDIASIIVKFLPNGCITFPCIYQSKFCKIDYLTDGSIICRFVNSNKSENNDNHSLSSSTIIFPHFISLSNLDDLDNQKKG